MGRGARSGRKYYRRGWSHLGKMHWPLPPSTHHTIWETRFWIYRRSSHRSYTSSTTTFNIFMECLEIGLFRWRFTRTIIYITLPFALIHINPHTLNKLAVYACKHTVQNRQIMLGFRESRWKEVEMLDEDEGERERGAGGRGSECGIDTHRFVLHSAPCLRYLYIYT